MRRSPGSSGKWEPSPHFHDKPGVRSEYLPSGKAVGDISEALILPAPGQQWKILIPQTSRIYIQSSESLSSENHLYQIISLTTC